MSSMEDGPSEEYDDDELSQSKDSNQKENDAPNLQPFEDDESYEQSSLISEADIREIEDIVRKKIQIESVRQSKKLEDFEYPETQEEKFEQKHNWRNKARSKLEILNQIKLGTDQTITILPQSLNEEEQIQLSISKAQRYNNSIVEFRKQMKEKFKDYENNRVASRQSIPSNLFPSNHIPLILKNEQQTIIIPPQNLMVRKGTIESFIKMNLDNEPQLYQQEMQKRMGLSKIQKRKPYQKRKLPEN